MLEKHNEINQKAFDKIQKTADELLRERDAIHKELKKTESMYFSKFDCVDVMNESHLDLGN